MIEFVITDYFGYIYFKGTWEQVINEWNEYYSCTHAEEYNQIGYCIMSYITYRQYEKDNKFSE